MEIENGLNFYLNGFIRSILHSLLNSWGRGGGYINRILYEFLTISERKCVSLFFSRLSEISFDKILKVIHSYHPTSQ